MVRLDYNNEEVLKACWALLDKAEPIQLEITGAKARLVACAFPHYVDHLDPRRGRKQQRISLLKFALLGAFATPALWAMCNRAILNNIGFRGRKLAHSFIVEFGSPS